MFEHESLARIQVGEKNFTASTWKYYLKEKMSIKCRRMHKNIYFTFLKRIWSVKWKVTTINVLVLLQSCHIIISSNFSLRKSADKKFDD